MNRAGFIVGVLLVLVGCSDGGNRSASNVVIPSDADRLEHFEHALDYFDASSPPVEQPAAVFTDAVECDGHRCCDPTCPVVEGNEGQACNDKEVNVGHVALTDDPFCVSMFEKLEAVNCASVRCQTEGCGGSFEEFFLGCMRRD